MRVCSLFTLVDELRIVPRTICHGQSGVKLVARNTCEFFFFFSVYFVFVAFKLLCQAVHVAYEAIEHSLVNLVTRAGFNEKSF